MTTSDSATTLPAPQTAAPTPEPADTRVPTVRIRPTSGWQAMDWLEMWRFRELLFFFVWRDLMVRYRQTVLGAAWAVLKPLLSMVVFTLVFGRLAKLSSDGLPYSVFAYTALVPWTYFAGTLSGATNSLVGSSHLITKVYFPRVLVPASVAIVNLVDFFVAFALVLPLMWWNGLFPSLAGLLIVLGLSFVLAALTLGISLVFSAVTVRFRDLGNLLPVALQLWMYGTPIIYPLSMVPEQYRWMLALNPVTGIVTGMRSALFDLPWDFLPLTVSLLTAGFSVLLGLAYFRRVEKAFADIV